MLQGFSLCSVMITASRNEIVGSPKGVNANIHPYDLGPSCSDQKARNEHGYLNVIAWNRHRLVDHGKPVGEPCDFASCETKFQAATAANINKNPEWSRLNDVPRQVLVSLTSEAPPRKNSWKSNE
ncbi:hypothetical protein CA13_61690 [Planctomycetes bacterium CA13]|uniref:Uncharacterized protein n=1 Tax=Novipirellula herctigrandis TaxID=2527986 RepID=A0A5C5ZBC3_9BACT|nr:hypothetical protein CA13_61690 [Planctomycetes bacterium CA13]